MTRRPDGPGWVELPFRGGPKDGDSTWIRHGNPDGSWNRQILQAEDCIFIDPADDPLSKTWHHPLHRYVFNPGGGQFIYAGRVPVPEDRRPQS